MHTLKKIGKILLYVVLGLVVLLFIAGLFIDPIAKNLLEKQVSKAAEGQYSLAVEDLDISILGGDVVLYGVVLTTDTVEADSPPIVFLKANEVAVEGVSWLTYLLDKRLQTDRIFLDQLDVELLARTVAQSQGSQDTTKNPGPFKLEQLDIYPAIKKQVDRVLLEDLGLIDLTLTLINVSTQDTLKFNAGELNFKSNNVLVDANKLITDARAFYATRINLVGKELLVERTGNNNLHGEAEMLQFLTKEEKMSAFGSKMLFLLDTLPNVDTTLFVGLEDFEFRELNLNRLQEEGVAPINKIGLTGLKVVNNMPPQSKSSPGADTAQSAVNLAQLSFGKSLPPFMDRVELDVLDINQVYVRQGDSIKVEDFNLHADNIVLGNEAAFAKNRFLHAASMESKTQKIKVSMGDPLQNLVLTGLRMDFDNGTGMIAFKELEINPSDTIDEKLWYEGVVGPVKVVGINTTELMERKLAIDSIGIMDPQVLVNMPAPAPQSEQKASSQQAYTPPTLYPAIEGILDQLLLRKLAVISADIRVADIGGSEYGVLIPEGYLQLTDVLIAEGTAYEDKRVLHAADIAVRLENIQFPMPDSVYSAELGLFRLSTYEQFLEADNFQLTFSDDFKQMLKGPETNQVFRITNDDFRMDGVQYSKMIENKGIYIATIKADGLDAYLYQDANQPTKKKEPKPTPMPQKRLRQLDMPVYIGSFLLESGHLKYEQLASGADSLGAVEVTDIFASAANVTNLPDLMREKPEMTVQFGGKLTGTGDFENELSFNLLSDSNLVEIKGSVDTLDLTRLNEMVAYTSPVTISSGQLYGMNWEIRADEKNANGTLLIAYEDLKIQLGESDGTDTTGLFKDIGSFLINKLAVNSDVPADDPKEPKKVDISHERDKEQGFINYYVQSLVDGLKEVVVTIF